MAMQVEFEEDSGGDRVFLHSHCNKCLQDIVEAIPALMLYGVDIN
jgi:hypothetical protein